MKGRPVVAFGSLAPPNENFRMRSARLEKRMHKKRKVNSCFVIEESNFIVAFSKKNLLSDYYNYGNFFPKMLAFLFKTSP